MKKLLIIVAAIFAISCSERAKTEKVITVSIDPLGWIASSLVDSTVRVEVLVPSGSSPETYEPTARQIEDLSRSQIYLSTGLLDFEGELNSKMTSVAPNTTLVNLSDSVDVIASSCSHAEHSGHAHGVDPHIWLSPKAMKKMINQAATAIVSNGISDEQSVFARRDSLLLIVETIDQYIESKADDTATKSFAIVHPSLSYYAKDYGLHQIALEIDGKEPSAASIRTIVDQLRGEGVKTIFYGIQTSDAVAKVVATEINCSLTPYDPLAANWPQSMIEITDHIYGIN